jgi:hypothetical protein
MSPIALRINAVRTCRGQDAPDNFLRHYVIDTHQ